MANMLINEFVTFEQVVQVYIFKFSKQAFDKSCLYSFTTVYNLMNDRNMIDN